MNILFALLTLTAVVQAIVTPDGFTGVSNTGSMQAIPPVAKAPGTFSNGKDPLLGEPADTLNQPPDVYGAREVDIPIGRLFHGHLNFFPTVNDPTKDTNVWGSDKDDAEQSACGIPASAYFISGVAIHPYFLKYAGLDRYCMQDVCIWFWKEDGSSDMLLKVTDICTPDSADGVPCLDPQDIKIDRTKAGIIMNNLKEPVPSGNQYPEKVWWLFTKCSFDGLAQPAYVNNSNWFSEPYLPNNDRWVQYTATQQYINNQKSYPANGWDTYPPGLYNISRADNPITDWDPANPTSWSPIAGGRGSSLANSSCSWPSSVSASHSPTLLLSASNEESTASQMMATQENQLTKSDVSPTSQVMAMSSTPSAVSEANTAVATLLVVPMPQQTTTTTSMMMSTSQLELTSTVYVCGTKTLS